MRTDGNTEIRDTPPNITNSNLTLVCTEHCGGCDISTHELSSSQQIVCDVLYACFIQYIEHKLQLLVGYFRKDRDKVEVKWISLYDSSNTTVF